MTRVVRVWSCPCCRISGRRSKGDTYAPHCRTCGERMVSGFGYKEARACRHFRAEVTVRKFNERLGSKVRTQVQLAYQPSRHVKALWRDVRRAKTRPAVIRRAETWMAAVLGETRAAEGETRWTTTKSIERGEDWYGRRGPRVVTHRSRASWNATPTMERVALPRGLHGDYRRSILKGVYGIRVNAADPIDELRTTIVHEVLHLLDSEARIKEPGHGRLWAKRLAQMARWFPASGVTR